MSRISSHIRHAWENLGRRVNRALPIESNLSPTLEQFAFAAREIGVPQSAARTAFAVAMRGDPAPFNPPPVPSRHERLEMA